MAWPFTRLTTYVASGPPAIKSVDLNGVQDEVAIHAHALSRDYFTLIDDFTGEEIDKGRWEIQAADIAVGDDSANGALGAVELNTTNNTYFRTFTGLAIGAGDFRFYARLRWPTKTAALAVVGLSNPVGPVHRAVFRAGSADATWFAECDGTSVDTGVAINTTYSRFYIERKAGTVHFFIDDVEVATIAYATAFSDAKAGVFTSTATLSVIWVDVCKLLAVRT